MKSEKDFNDSDEGMREILTHHSLKPIPDSLMENYLTEVRAKINVEKSKRAGFGFASGIAIPIFAYALALAFSFGVYWLNGRPDVEKPVIEIEELAPAVRFLVPTGTRNLTTAAPLEIREPVNIESDAELAALLSLLGEDDGFLDSEDVSLDVERMNQWQVQQSGNMIRTS